MKSTSRLLVSLLSLVGLGLPAQAQISAADSAVLNQIRQQNQHWKTIQCPFQHNVERKKETSARYGSVYIERLKPATEGDIVAQVAMHYTQPEGDCYIITATDLYNGISGHDWHFRFRSGKSSLWKQLGNAMAWAITGDVYSLYNNFNTKLTVESDSHSYTVTLNAVGFNKGISRIVLRYSRATGLIHHLELKEKFGKTHKYTLGLDAKGRRHTPQTDAPLPSSVFVIKD